MAVRETEWKSWTIAISSLAAWRARGYSGLSRSPCSRLRSARCWRRSRRPAAPWRGFCVPFLRMDRQTGRVSWPREPIDDVDNARRRDRAPPTGIAASDSASRYFVPPMPHPYAGRRPEPRRRPAPLPSRLNSRPAVQPQARAPIVREAVSPSSCGDFLRPWWRIEAPSPESDEPPESPLLGNID